MSAAHTPGPWAVNPLMLNQIATADAAHEVAQATVLHPSAVTVANARLIAAAPELLEALQNMHNVLKEAMSTGGWIPTPVQDSFRDAWVEVTGSIAKATGAQA